MEDVRRHSQASVERMLGKRPREDAGSSSNRASTARPSTSKWDEALVQEEEEVLEAEAEEEEEGEEVEDDEDMWEDAMPVNSILHTGVDLEIMVDRPEEPPAAQPSEPTVQREPTAEEKKIQRREQRAQSLRQAAVAEHAHRVHLQCWLAHGQLLSAQADDAALRARVKAAAPAEACAPPHAMSHAELLRLAEWMEGRGGGRGAGRGGGMAGGRGRRGRGRGGEAASAGGAAAARLDEIWGLLRLAAAASGRRAPAWAAAALPAALSVLCALSSPAAGALPFYEPPSTSDEELQALAEQLLTCYTPSSPDPPPNELQLLFDAADGGGSVAQRLLLHLTLWRALGLRARLVMALQPLPRKPPSASRATSAVPTQGTEVEQQRTLHAPMWLEAFLASENRWYPVDLADSAQIRHGVPASILSARVPARAARRAYIVSFEPHGCRDVTARYVPATSSLKPHRVADDWWQATLRACSPRGEISTQQTGASTSSSHAAQRREEVEMADAAEAEELRRSAEQQPLPTSLTEYKGHPLYVLERDIGRHQVLHPPHTPPLGLCKGQRVYPRGALREVKTRERWHREGRTVREGEAPCKRLPKPQGARAGAASSSSATEVEMGFFGVWQTDEYIPPFATDGIVPRSSHGHVELWSAAHLPIGTVQLRQPNVAQAARQLGIDFAPAMVGFDMRDGRSVPRFDGVVVCIEASEVLVEAASEIQQREEDKAAHKRRKEATEVWRTLLRAICVRSRIRAEYGA